MGDFKLITGFTPKGDQPEAITALTTGAINGRQQVLLGVTGSGKTFTIANVIANLGLPALVIAHNKTLAAQLYGEFKELFPQNAVEYFVSYYDYYQPEAYIPKTDTYIAKDAMVNEDIDRLRHSATMSVLERRDSIVVASVSCIYGIGSPEDYLGMHLVIKEGDSISRASLLEQLTALQYERREREFKRGTIRVRGDIVEVFPAFSMDKGIRVEYFGDDIDAIYEFDPISGLRLRRLKTAAIYPRSHWITPRERIEGALAGIKREMRAQVEYFLRQGKPAEAQRIEQRTMFDLEMLKEFGFCNGIENYSRHLSGRAPGQPPFTLIDYFPDDMLIVIDESHVTIPQIGGMYEGDKVRKQTLIDYGFRLPSALDNRPLRFAEFEGRLKAVIYVSATPAKYELNRAEGNIVEQIIRPTGLLDPEMFVRPVSGQVDDLIREIRLVTERKERVLVTTLTKKMAEDLSEYYNELGIRTRYLHSDIDTLDRVKILQDLRMGVFDCLVGVNLLREGLDLPEVSLVAIFDADKEGFLRSEKSLIQTAGRGARNVNSKVLLYADTITGSMRRAMDETTRRRKKQLQYNEEMGITPETVINNIKNILATIYEADYWTVPVEPSDSDIEILDAFDDNKLKALELEMREAAGKLDFERAATIRDKIKTIREKALAVGV
ncbi:excinuclease ABC subunit UvrB [Candidatus Magnetominusculus xianensis]|uniref:UvrABC system protein B n=1 Tax=Candidatus Magnetominusculus xianensis TaxID=1748249 RepID=A0ABR5SE61_9BACT|nr:excinuclease ABC subunit UvrB [Candidatus Magnetominusculus xianensis]KWT82641.1 excinuclease ABC subunit B [Candidatus Magnetominusculus xianensis]MBF0405290.1 excinuclease ABC subunit UvrB [Nitrospirota bacterium]